jgi:branched-chain amino acid transport system ATP-binding protein
MVENMSNVVLSLEDIEAGYYERVVLKNIKMETKKNEIVLLIGPNGAGKSTLLKVVAGILKPWKGKVKFEGKELDGYSPAKRARMGISYFFQGGEVFPDLTIIENLELAGLGLNKKKFNQKLEEIFQFFPDLKNMKGKRAGLLSGGERHQLAIGMIFIRDPKLILLDEPSAGLSPLLVSELLKKIELIKDRLNASVLIVEQNVKEGLKISDRIYLMKAGEIVKESYPAEIEKENLLERVFFE